MLAGWGGRVGWEGMGVCSLGEVGGRLRWSFSGRQISDARTQARLAQSVARELFRSTTVLNPRPLSNFLVAEMLKSTHQKAPPPGSAPAEPVLPPGWTAHVAPTGAQSTEPPLQTANDGQDTRITTMPHSTSPRTHAPSPLPPRLLPHPSRATVPASLPRASHPPHSPTPAGESPSAAAATPGGEGAAAAGVGSA
jgi:hypothetical protein